MSTDERTNTTTRGTTARTEQQRAAEHDQGDDTGGRTAGEVVASTTSGLSTEPAPAVTHQQRQVDTSMTSGLSMVSAPTTARQQQHAVGHDRAEDSRQEAATRVITSTSSGSSIESTPAATCRQPHQQQPATGCLGTSSTPGLLKAPNPVATCHSQTRHRAVYVTDTGAAATVGT